MNSPIKTTFLFPGQGAQYVAMGADLYAASPAARAVFDEADAVLGRPLSRLCFEGPEAELTRTANTQPALLAHSLACHAAFQELALQAGGAVIPDAVAGHSVGEYAALVVAGALSLADGLRLVQARGDAMDAHGTGKMLALRMDADTARPIASRFFCDVAVVNLPRQTVVGGHADDLAALQTHLTEAGQNPGVLLNTSGAFHTHLMVQAALAFRATLLEADFKTPTVPVLSNYQGTWHAADPQAIKAELFFQIFNPVRWADLMDVTLSAGNTTCVEFGGGAGGGKRARLAAMTLKAFRRNRLKGQHLAAISVDGIAQAHAALIA
ncbi:MAG: malonyl CoA-acyl carrier protein transacylase [Bradymonadia bacterium]|jgi:malonyl CoA-acyl carrier protein transacylase